MRIHFKAKKHKVLTYIEHHRLTVYVPSSELGLPQPLSRKRLCLPPRTKGWGGAHSPAAKGVGESQFRRLEKTEHSAYSVRKSKRYGPIYFILDQNLNDLKPLFLPQTRSNEKKIISRYCPFNGDTINKDHM
jgi:hypothetical protein